MQKSDVIAHFGSVSAAADALGITSQAISMWPDAVPMGRQYQLEKITNGKLQAVIPNGKAGPAAAQRV